MDKLWNISDDGRYYIESEFRKADGKQVRVSWPVMYFDKDGNAVTQDGTVYGMEDYDAKTVQHECTS